MFELKCDLKESFTFFWHDDPFVLKGSCQSHWQVRWAEVQVRQLLQMANQQQSKFDLRPLVFAIDTMKQKITLLEPMTKD